MLGVLHAVGLAVGDDDGGVVQEAVEDADGGGLLWQESAPLLKGPVRADGQGSAFVGASDEPEQQLRCGVSSSGAKPSSSRMIRSTRSRDSMILPTVLSARPR